MPSRALRITLAVAVSTFMSIHLCLFVVEDEIFFKEGVREFVD